MVVSFSSDKSDFAPAKSDNKNRHDFRVILVGSENPTNWPPIIFTKERQSVKPIFVGLAGFDNYLDNFEEGAPLAAAFLVSENIENALNLANTLRSKKQFYRTRIYIISSNYNELGSFGHSIDRNDTLDIEQIIAKSSLDFYNSSSFTQITENAIRAYCSIESNPLMSDYYLNATYNEVFDWFETTRWDWSELTDLSGIQKDLVTDEDIEILKESAIIEFGTLPGAHNFLREWADEYSFSSWALSWGAEEARHSLVQCRYLREMGVNIRAKHAMYKRQPYPLGEDQAGTLMMNIISESRAAEYYRKLSNQTQEPVLKKIWKILGHDEARHARAFYIFCKELCQANEKHLLQSLKMAYVWLADREKGVKHPAGLFFPHSTSTDGLREIEQSQDKMTDRADARVLAMCGNLVGDNSIKSVKDLKNTMRNFF